MSENHFDELLATVAAESAAINSSRLEILAEIGEKALPEIREKADFVDLTAKLDEVEKQAEAIQERTEKIREEKEKYERAEKERLARYTCPACQKVNAEGAGFCEECGHKVGELPREFCKVCCTMNQKGLKFCGECGTKLDEIVEQ